MKIWKDIIIYGIGFLILGSCALEFLWGFAIVMLKLWQGDSWDWLYYPAKLP